MQCTATADILYFVTISQGHLAQRLILELSGWGPLPRWHLTLLGGRHPIPREQSCCLELALSSRPVPSLLPLLFESAALLGSDDAALSTTSGASCHFRRELVAALTLSPSCLRPWTLPAPAEKAMWCQSAAARTTISAFRS